MLAETEGLAVELFSELDDYLFVGFLEFFLLVPFRNDYLFQLSAFTLLYCQLVLELAYSGAELLEIEIASVFLFDEDVSDLSELGTG